LRLRLLTKCMLFVVLELIRAFSIARTMTMPSLWLFARNVSWLVTLTREICAFVGHINLQTNDEQEGISLVQTSHTLVSSTPQALQNPVFVPSSVPGGEQNTHSIVPDLLSRTVDPPLAVVPDAPIINNP